MKLINYKVLDDYLVINDTLYYELSSLSRIRLDENYLKLDKESCVGEWFNLVDFGGDMSELIKFVESTNKLVKDDAKSKEYLVIEWGIFFFIMLMVAVVSCFVGMVIGVSCGIQV